MPRYQVNCCPYFERREPEEIDLEQEARKGAWPTDNILAAYISARRHTAKCRMAQDKAKDDVEEAIGKERAIGRQLRDALSKL